MFKKFSGKNTDAAAKQQLQDAGFTVFPDKFSTRYFSALNFSPSTIFDIGVNEGTPWFYQSFPDGRKVLIEPRQDSLDTTLKAFPEFEFETFCCALGSENSTATLNVVARPGWSGIPERAAIAAAEVEETVEVPVRRLDEIATEFSGPFGLKIDTEGYELEVLKGAAGIMQQCEFIIAEVSVMKRFQNGYRFSDIISFMREFDFELLDVLNPQRRPTRFMDCMFVKYDNPLLG
jgi:FkbM family methyltransferase